MIFNRNKKDKDESKVNVKKTFTFTFYMMVIWAIVAFIGVILFIFYYNTNNIVFGFLSIISLSAGVFFFRLFWKKRENITVEHIGDEIKKDDCNCLNIYPNKVLFENMPKPEGFPWKCTNDGKKYYVNIWDTITNGFIPFVLPDQQYLDPALLAQRVLELPAHKRIFERKPKLLQKLKTLFLVIGIGIVWLLILTTEGS